jgi:tetratricopeptide (TPR) repeat protein
MSERGRIVLIMAGGAVALGAAGWLPGPVWAAIGVAAGAFAPVVVIAVWRTVTVPYATALLKKGRPQEALLKADQDARTYIPDLAASVTRQAVLLAWLGRPGDALTAAGEASDMYQNALPWDKLPYHAARALIVQGQLLCELSRRREAAQPFARGWRLAGSRNHQDLLQLAEPALKAVYRADPPGFTRAWRAELGSEPLPWLSNDNGAIGGT